MDDLTSALYLGFCHSASQVAPWQCLTTGIPAALREPSLNQQVADLVAKMQGLARGVIAPSSLHLFWDIFGKTGSDTTILADDKLYAVGKWGLERAAARGASVIYFKHQDAGDLRLKLQRYVKEGVSLFVVTDGWCPHCGKPAPLPDYLQLTRKYGGILVLDDTQAFGILGAQPGGKKLPCGKGGGGLLQWFNLQGDDILTVCSLAKGLGVPLSVLSGSQRRIAAFKSESETRVHSSPVSAAHVQAAVLALSKNKTKGDLLRLRLFQNIKLFREHVSQYGFSLKGSFFPVQTLRLSSGGDPYAFYQHLTALGVKALLLEPHQGRKASISFCITARHRPERLQRIAALINEAHQHYQRNVLSYVPATTRTASRKLI